MKILVIGNGGREHALAWKLAQSNAVQEVYVAPGNAGTHREPKVQNVAIEPLDFAALSDFAKAQAIDFTLVGPEVPLVAGIVDDFDQKNLLCLGPSQFAAQLEGSKSFAKRFMQRYHIPTADGQVFSDTHQAYTYLNSCHFPLVIKADGLAAGKGVVIAKDLAHAQATIEQMLALNHFGEAGHQIVIEEFIEGEEVSFIVACDGKNILPLATSQDHKTRDEGDQGPNTGGMGAYSPATIITPDLEQQILEQVIQPTIQGMQEQGHPFCGFLYAGLMIKNHQIKVLEFNCRFGDPETQVILMRLTSDFSQLCLSMLHHNLDQYTAQWDPRPALGVILAAHGYPDHYQKGETVPTLNEIPPSDQYKIFHAGTLLEEGKIVTNGGRVLCVCALGNTLLDAYDKTYRLVNKVKWNSVFYRSDIGHRALKS